MAKRQSNTLFNYFQSPKGSPQALKSKENGGSTPRKTLIYGNSKTKKNESDSEEETFKPKKRSRIQVMDDSSDSDNGTPQKQTAKRLKSTGSHSSEAENSPPKKTKVEKLDAAPKSKKSALDFTKGKPFSLTTLESRIGENIKTSTNADSLKVDSNIKDIHTNWLHNTLEFLQPNKIMDANKKKPTDPEYDPTSLYVPENYLKTLTPAMRQWWELKSQYWDTVLFFKVGKFYELYHMDAVIGVQHLGFTYMKGEFAHSGFPETAYGKMASLLLERGFKVARCEQTETPEMMEARCKLLKKTTKFDKVVRREICQVSAKAATIFTAQMAESQNAQANYMFAVAIKVNAADSVRLGVCFVETSIGTFHLAEFDDDKHFSKLLAIFTEYPAALILYEKNCVNKNFLKMLNTQFKDIRKESLLPKKQFYNASETLEKLCSAEYFRDKSGNFHWPKLFNVVADDCLPKKHYELAVSSLGACLWYLTHAKLDIQVFSMGMFELYDPLDFISVSKQDKKDYLILDVTTITNLNLLGNVGTLQSTIDHCKTPFGKRLLHQWICRPLCDIRKIQERQKAVGELWNNSSLLCDAQALLKTLPDLERMLAKIHVYGNKLLTTNHPDSRAIFYEAVTYSKKKIQDFVKVLKAFEAVQELPQIFKGIVSLPNDTIYLFKKLRKIYLQRKIFRL